MPPRAGRTCFLPATGRYRVAGDDRGSPSLRGNGCGARLDERTHWTSWRRSRSTSARAATGADASAADDGHWVFELEADATIPAEYVLLRQYLGEPDDPELERKIGVYLRRIQAEHGGWPLFHGGAFDISASVKAYFCLKMIGDSPDAPHMARARSAILAHGGAHARQCLHAHPAGAVRRTLVEHVPTIPVELILLPRWFPIHLSTHVLLGAHRDGALAGPGGAQGAGAKRARRSHPGALRHDRARRRPRPRAHQQRGWALFFSGLDRVLKVVEPLWPKSPAPSRHRALRGVSSTERLNGEDGLGAIYPAMANCRDDVSTPWATRRSIPTAPSPAGRSTSCW